MAVKTIQMDFAGQVDVIPRLGKMTTTDDLATVTTAGYLNSAKATEGINFYPTDMMEVAYNGGTALFNLSITQTGIITLNQYGGTPITLPTWVTDTVPGTLGVNAAFATDGSGNLNSVPYAQYPAAATFVNTVAAYPATATQVGQAASYVTDMLNGGVTPGDNIASVNYTEALTVTAVEVDASVVLNSLEKANTFTSTSIPASGSCAVTLTFKNPNGTLINASGFLCLSDVNGNMNQTAITSIVATTGTSYQLVTGLIISFATVSNTLGLTLTGGAGTYYLQWIKEGQLTGTSGIITGPLVINP